MLLYFYECDNDLDWRRRDPTTVRDLFNYLGLRSQIHCMCHPAQSNNEISSTDILYNNNNNTG